MVQGWGVLAVSVAHFCVFWCVSAFEILGVYTYVIKCLERSWRTTPNLRKEHGAVQCKVQSLSLSLSFSNTSLMGFSGKQRSFSHLCLSPTHFLSPLSLLATASSLLSLFRWLHVIFFLFFCFCLLFSCIWSCCFCPVAKMCPPSGVFEPLNWAKKNC